MIPKIGIIGGGQLARMMAIAAAQLGIEARLLDPHPNAPAAQVCTEHIQAKFSDESALTELASKCDWITYEQEGIPITPTLRKMDDTDKLPQGIQALQIGQHRRLEKQFLVSCGFETAKHSYAYKNQPFEDNDFGFPRVIKTCLGGYDGLGQIVVQDEVQQQEALNKLWQDSDELIVEELITHRRELSVIVARSSTSCTVAYGPIENVHRSGILRYSSVCNSWGRNSASAAIRIATHLAEALNYIGTMAVEMFELLDGSLLVNEFAPRPHNSGHYSLDACLHSQFDNHIRALCKIPLGLPGHHSKAIMRNILGEELSAVLNNLESIPACAKIHLYGKHPARKGRKMGHINFVNPDEQALWSQWQEFERKCDIFLY